jgi:hypothetical protein
MDQANRRIDEPASEESKVKKAWQLSLNSSAHLLSGSCLVDRQAREGHG